jgi:CRISPR-associated protein (TIGR03986 family)
MPDEKLIAEALRILRGKFRAGSRLMDVVAYLEGFAPFDEMEPDDIQAIAAEAISRLQPQPLRLSPSRTSQRPGRRSIRADLKASAPFRFVTLPDQVVFETPLPRHLPIPSGFCARIDVEWAAETPLLIGEQSEDGDAVVPLQFGRSGNYVIPGATLRGMIRAAVEIIAHGRLGSANLHHRYGLRDFEHPAYAERSPVSRVAEVKAGWLNLTGDRRWQITPCAWAHVLIDDLLSTDYGSLRRERRENWIQRSLEQKYAAAGMRPGAQYDFTKTFGFSASYEENGRQIVKPGSTRQGTLVFAGPLPGRGNKKYEYVFFAPDGPSVCVAPSVVSVFERLYSRPSKNRPMPDGSWKELRPTLKNGGRLPVFYVGDLEHQDDRFFFGLTRLFKVPHERSLGDVLGTQPNHIQRWRDGTGNTVSKYDSDFVENLFGYVIEPGDLGAAAGERAAPDAVGLKGRIAFSFAHLRTGQDTAVPEPVTTIMMAPRPSFAPFYLKSATEKDYSAATSPRLAGRKRYLPRRINGSIVQSLGDIRAMGQRQIDRVASRGPVSDDVKSILVFLLPRKAEDLSFESTIRLDNVTSAELGAVLFALTHGGDPAKPYRHMIGRAKPFGAGQLRVSCARLMVEPNDGKSELVRPPDDDEIVSPDRKRGFCPQPAPDEAPLSNASHRPFLDAFAQRMRAVPGLATFPDLPVVREFLGASEPGETAKLKDALDYLQLGDFNEIRRAVKPLRQQGPSAAPLLPAVFPEERDGRLLAAPMSTRQLWQRSPSKGGLR